ncbi:MAG TPA: hypothetical protein VKV26_10450 [Dehalococcoidia bacterium]|nr:hypothetical protein [Dehalococcoidia bacterium]
MFAVSDIILWATIAGVLGVLVSSLWPWARARWRYLLVGASTLCGFLGWNLVLHVTNGRGFNVDAPLIGLSWADAGSGVVAFLLTALLFGGVWDRSEPAARVVGLAVIAGAVATGLDLFVL